MKINEHIINASFYTWVKQTNLELKKVKNSIIMLFQFRQAEPPGTPGFPRETASAEALLYPPNKPHNAQ